MLDCFACPHCGTPLDAAPAAAPQDVVCLRCGGLTVVPALNGSLEQPDDPPQAVEVRQDELSALRIRQLAAARRAAYRSRSHCVVGALVCVVAVVQLAWMAVRWMRIAGLTLRPIAYVLVALLAAWGAFYFFRKAMELDHEAKRSDLPAPTGEPDFAPLGDGSQQWKNLEDVR